MGYLPSVVRPGLPKAMTSTLKKQKNKNKNKLWPKVKPLLSAVSGFEEAAYLVK